jgi:hypothetical protein
VVWSDARPALTFSLGAPPTGIVPPWARPRLALSPGGQPALVFREVATGGWDLTLATQGTRQKLGVSSPEEHVSAWASERTPAAVWRSADRTQVSTSLGAVAMWPAWSDVAALSREGGLLIAAAAPQRVALFAQDEAGMVTTLVDRTVDAYNEGTLHLVRGAELAYYMGTIVKIHRSQAYTLSATPGALPRPVAVPAEGALDAIILGPRGQSPWLLAPRDDGAHLLDALALGQPAVPQALVIDGPDERAAAVEPLALDAQGIFTLGVIRDGHVELRNYVADLACR